MSAPEANAPRPGRRALVVVAVVALGAVAAAVAWWATRPKPDPPVVPDPDPAAPGADTGVAPWFRDVTAGSGLDFTYRNGREAGRHAILESLGGGVGLLDYDGDGLLDVFVVGGGALDAPAPRGHPCKLYRNRGDFKFEDVTAKAGLGGVAWWYTHGVAVADYDRDGWPDLLVTGYGRVALFHNVPDGAGGRRFADASEKLGPADAAWSTSAAWADLDGDGFPDLYVCRYCDWSPANDPACPAQTPRAARDICTPGRFKPLAHALFRNVKGTAFARWPLADPPPTGYGLGVVAADLNGDGRPDLYVANDTSNKFLFLNRGGRFDEVGVAAGVATDENGRPDGSMGVDVGDYDGTGRPSVWVTNFQNQYHALYRNLGGGTFAHQSRAAGVAALGQRYVGFGTAFLDADGDGWEDLVIANGNVFTSLPDEDEKQRPVLLRNTDRGGRRVFEEASARGGPFFRARALGRGLAVGDLNNDGRPDLVVVHTNAPVAVLRNVADEAAPAEWVGVRLVGRGHRDVAGSTVTATTGDGRRLTRFAKGGGSYLSAPDPRLLFGLGPAGRVARVTVRWSWGDEQTWEGLAPGRYWELREGEPAGRNAERGIRNSE